MIRTNKGEKKYWDKWVGFSFEHINKKWSLLTLPSNNPTYDPQFCFNLANQTLELILYRYSRGDSVSELAQHFEGLLNAWELSNKLSDEVCKDHNLRSCRDWDFNLSNLNHYNWCFWLVGLALSLEIPESQWERLIVLIGGEGEDVLLDRVIACRSFDRAVGAKLLHDRPYARLLKAIDTHLDIETAQSYTQTLGVSPYSINYKEDAIKGHQAAVLSEFLAHWYAELKRSAPKNSKAPTIEPFWYTYGDHNFEGGSYFGHWCIEAVAAVKAFGLDDSLCIGHEHYPNDLLRPNQVTTAQQNTPVSKISFFEKLFGKVKL